MKIFRKYCSRQFTTVSWHFAKKIGTSTYFICCCRVHTNAFSFSSKTHRTIRVHTNVFMRSRLSTKRYRIARCDVSWTLCACYKRTRLRYFLSSFSLDTSSTVYTIIRYVCISVLIHLVSKAFSNRCVFDENSQHISADGRPKRVELYAFSNENALVCAEPKATLLLP